MITTLINKGEIQFSFPAGGSVLPSKGGSLLASAEANARGLDAIAKPFATYKD